MTVVAARMADPEVGELDDIVDVDRYDLTGGTDAWTALGVAIADDLRGEGVARLPGFVRADAVSAIDDELERCLPYVPIVSDRRGVYAMPTTEDDHPARRAESDWRAGHITRDMVPPHSPAHRLYVSPLFKRLIAACVGVPRVFEYADPLAGLVATVVPPGGCYGWHYDTNEFVVTIAIREAERGGRFEYSKDLRRPCDENLDGLARLMAGDDGGTIRSIAARPGDLQIFRGRYSLHRVTEVAGGELRLTLVLSYAERPGVIGPVDRTRRVYGRVTEAHLIAGSVCHGSDGLIL